MSCILLNLYGAHDRLRVEADEGTLWIRSSDEYGMTSNTVSLRLTSADVSAIRAALDALDTTNADADLADEQEAA